MQGSCIFCPCGSRNGEAGQIPFDVGEEHRDALGGKPFGQNLQRHGFACARRPCYQAVAVGVANVEKLLLGVVCARPRR